MNGYVVTVEVTPDTPSGEHDNVLDQIDNFFDRLSAHHGAVAGCEIGWSATVTVDADGPLEAQGYAVEAVLHHAEDVFLPSSPITRIEVVREDIRDAELARPSMPDLVSGLEAAQILDVSRQRLHQLTRTHPDFPAPAYSLTVGHLYHRAAIERFAQTWHRRPGRPSVDRGRIRPA